MRTLPARLGVVLLVVAAPVGVYLSPSDGPSYPKEWDARVVDLVHFVEKERGLAFEHPVAVEFLQDKDFVAKVTEPEPSAQDRKDTEEFLEVLRALGLVSGHPDLFAAHNRLVGNDVVGVYVPDEKALYVRGTELTPYVRATAVHELTHALQDQHFDLEGLQDDAPGGDDTAATALIEGDAMRVEYAYVRALPSIDHDTYESESGDLASSSDKGLDDVPQVLKDRLSLPYVFGPVLLDTLVADGGNAAVDEAFRHPPYTEAQVLDPRTYPPTWKSSELDDPELPKDAKKIDDSTPFGQASLVEVLGTRLGYTRSWGAVQGWSGDVMLPYRLGDKACVAATVAFTDDAGAARFGDAVRAWGATSVEVAGNRQVGFDACDPGEGRQPKPVEPSAFGVLSTRASLIHTLMREDGFGFKRARCVIDGLLTELAPSGLSLLAEDEVSTAEEAQLRRAFSKAAQSC